MIALRDIIWWLCFLAAAVGIQAWIPGLDVMTVGLIILLQERDYKNMLWLLPLFILLQEGMGTRVFGGVIVWYMAVIVLFRMGRWLFEAENFLFIFLLSACLGAAYFAVAWLMAPLQDLPFNFQDTLDKSLIQAIFIPFAWKLLVATRHGKAHAAEN
ncbi:MULTISPECIES: hypothetical protein [unclassified Desulfovibrio]|uniref:hypothetical protein n=1 Tax=unclassified Desulfovibrio TaxID=2593640 RepID=UPI002FDAF850